MVAVPEKKWLSSAAFSLSLAGFVLIVGFYLYNIVAWKDYPDLGFSLRSATGLNVVGVVRDHGSAAGIRVGDHIKDVNRRTYASIEELRWAINWGPGAENLWRIERDGAELLITIKNIPSGIARSVTISGFPFLLGFCYALIGVLVFLMKPHGRPSWIFLLFSFTFGIFVIYLNPLGRISPAWLENPNIFAYCFTPAVFIHLALSFPEERRYSSRFDFVQWLPYIVSLALFVAIRRVTGMMFYAPKALQIAAVAYMAIGVVFFLGSCLQLRIASKSQIVKLRARLILLGFAISASVPLLDYVANALFRVYVVPSFNYYLPFFLAFPAFVGYTIVKHDLFDIDAIIKRTYGYVLTTGALAGIYGLLVLASNLAFGGTEFARSPAFAIGFILAVVFLFNPVRDRVQRFIDRVFYRLEYDYQATVQKIGETMRSLLNLDQVGNAVMETALGTMFIDHGYVLLLDRDGKSYDCLVEAGAAETTGPRIAAGSTGAQAVGDGGANPVGAGVCGPEVAELKLPAEEPLLRKMAETGREVTVYDIEEDPAFEESREACRRTFEKMQAQLLVPLIYEDRLTGLIALGRKKSGKFYRREDINLLNVLANQGAVAVENARMVAEVIEKERMEEELSIARDLQVSMLPSECPQVAGFEIAAHSASAREVGGDFYDFIAMEGERVGMVVGDVTGKSVSGALVMSASRSVFRMLSEEERPVAANMMRANRRLKKDVKTGMFVALLYAVVDGPRHAVTLCSAGQTTPVFRAAAGGEVRLIETAGDTFPLGLLEDAAYEDTLLPMAAGDVLVLYTDGIVEAMSESNEMFGFNRLLDTVKESRAASAQGLLEEITGQVREFAGAAPQHDDLTLIVIRAL